MQIDATILGQLEQPRRKDFAIGDNDNHLRRQGLEQRMSFIVLEGFRLVDGQVELERFLFDGGWRERLSAPAGFIGLGDHAGNLVALFE